MLHDEILKAVFPLLGGVDLARCMLVCKQWREIGSDDYLWKCLCARKWPSTCKYANPPTITYFKLYKTFFKRHNRKSLPPPRLSFDLLEFFVDIWSDQTLIFSERVEGSQFRPQNDESDYKMTIPLVGRFKVSPFVETPCVSVLMSRLDSKKVASLVENASFDYIDRTAGRALAFDYLEFSPDHPFTYSVRAWISLLFVEESEGTLDVYGIQMDFCDAATCKDEVLWLLDILDWK